MELLRESPRGVNSHFSHENHSHQLASLSICVHLDGAFVVLSDAEDIVDESHVVEEAVSPSC